MRVVFRGSYGLFIVMLGAFAKLRKATISFVMFVCPSNSYTYCQKKKLRAVMSGEGVILNVNLHGQSRDFHTTDSILSDFTV